MKAIAYFIGIFAALTAACTSAADDPLANLISTIKKSGTSAPSPISLAATALFEDGEPCLRFTLTNISSKAFSVYPEDLPWGNAYSIIWAAVTVDGRTVPLGYPIDDPGPAEPISVDPGKAVTGTYRLSMMLRNAIPPHSDILIIWAYRVPSGPQEGSDFRALNTGTTVLHTP